MFFFYKMLCTQRIEHYNNVIGYLYETNLPK